MNDPEGLFKMKFIGWKDGKLMSGAPGNYVKDKVYQMRFRHSRFPWWELIEPPPELKVPDADEEDSVYDEVVFIPGDEASTEESKGEVTLSTPRTSNLDARTREVMESYKKQGLYLLDAEEGILVHPEEPLEKDERSRDELKQILDAAGIEYNDKAWDRTLQAMVEKLESEKEP